MSFSSQCDGVPDAVVLGMRRVRDDNTSILTF